MYYLMLVYDKLDYLEKDLLIHKGNGISFKLS